MLDEIFMWLKKLSLLKFNKQVAATWLFETFVYFKREARTSTKEKQWVKKDSDFPQENVI